MTLICCPTCGYPHDAETACTNPGCYANPSVPQVQKEAWREAAARRAAEEAERAHLRSIRFRMSSYRSSEPT